jgi:hypothetical protein
MTAEVNSAIRGAFDGGATEVVVTDAHSIGLNLISDEVDERARLISGTPRRLGMMEGVEEGDTIIIDIPAGTIDLAVSPDVIEQRKKSWRVPEHTGLKKGTLLERYRRLVGPATRGATFE